MNSLYRKQLLALAGFGLALFSFIHLLGNFLFLFGEETFNVYTHKLSEQWWIYIAEFGLCLFFLVHIFLGFYHTYLSLRKKIKTTSVEATLASKTMPLTGIFLLIFLILHLNHFKYADMEMVIYNEISYKNLYKVVFLFFQKEVNLLFYILSMMMIGLHLQHGIFSVTQSFGFLTAQNKNFFKKLSFFYALLISLGFSFIACFSYFQGAL
jgi:succinate dehydrogenase / fumarate reductase cytochrome b subunit